MMCLNLILMGVTSLILADASGAEKDPWAPCRFLLGEWVGEGAGGPGQANGGFSVAPDLAGKILVRRNHADYPAAGSRPATRHEDLMVIYPNEEGKGLQAAYWDNEGHFIQYSLQASGNPPALTFISDSLPRAPRFRLTYRQIQTDKVAIKFEIAPPGKPDSFRTYLEGEVRRKN
jgi:hypothetical protein